MTAPTAAASCLVVTAMDCGGFVVRGTTAPDVAWDAVVSVMRQQMDHLTPEEAEVVAPPPLTRVGLWRWTPCGHPSCDSYPTPHLQPAEARGRGVWEGVLFGG